MSVNNVKAIAYTVPKVDVSSVTVQICSLIRLDLVSSNVAVRSLLIRRLRRVSPVQLVVLLASP